jgi:hypothetical protein
MASTAGIARVDGLLSAGVRGGGLFGGLGATLGGLAGTFEWPVVGTFFGAIEGAVTGAVVGAIVAAALTALTLLTRSAWAARGMSGAIATLSALAASLSYDGPIDVPRTLAVTLVTSGVLTGAAFGPLIAFGMVPTSGKPPASVVGRYLSWGASIGAAAGAMVGLSLGATVYLPTAPVAAIEGAVFGVVIGAVLAGLAVVACVLPRVRTRP